MEDKCRELSKVCAEECVSCALHAKRLDDMDACISACNSCATICTKVIKASWLTEELLRKCEDACLACASVCSGYDDSRFHACADSCRKCAEACSMLILYGTFQKQ